MATKSITTQYDLSEAAREFWEDGHANIGKVFGQFSVVGMKNQNERIIWEVLCECGNRRMVRSDKLNNYLACRKCQRPEVSYTFNAPENLVNQVVILLSQSPFSVEELCISTASREESIMDCLSVLADQGRIVMSHAAPNKERLYSLKQVQPRRKTNTQQTDDTQGLSAWSQNFRAASLPLRRRDN